MYINIAKDKFIAKNNDSSRILYNIGRDKKAK